MKYLLLVHHVAKHIRDVSPEEMQQAMQKMAS